MTKGLIHVYTGDGKGKTTAGIGLAVRAKGNGLNVLFAQFFKEKSVSGEIPLLESIGVRTLVFDQVKAPFFNPGIDRLNLAEEAGKALEGLKEIIAAVRYDLVVLDEFICLLSEGVITESEALAFLSSKPYEQEIVLTGYGAPESLIASADYVTFMKKMKHPYSNKTGPRKGIEF